MSGCGCKGSANKSLDQDASKVLEALKKCDKPCGSKDIAEATGLDKKIVSKHITALKKKGLVDSPIRCKYGITEEGKSCIC